MSQDHNQHDHNHGSNTCCPPVEKSLWGYKKDIVFAILSGIFLLIGFLIEKFTDFPLGVFIIAYMVSYVFGGYYTLIHSIASLKVKKFDIDFLMLIAAVGAASLGKYAEGGLLLFLFSIGHALEHYAMEKATKSISSLSELTPDVALFKKNGKTEEISVSKLKVDDIVVVRPNSKIPADGVVIKGQSAVNQAPITGESIPVEKFPKPQYVPGDFEQIASRYKVFAGTINGSSALEIRVLKTTPDSTLSRLVQLVHEGEAQRAPAQHFANKFAAIFVPSVLGLVGLLLFAFVVRDETFQDSFYRAMAVLVAASPCALAISTPSAVLAGIARAIRGGILLKGGLPLHELARVDAIAFDKTGTLTTGFPILTKIVPYGGYAEDEVLVTAAAIESLSDHPLARAIVRGAGDHLNGAPIPRATDLEALTAMGVKAKIGGKEAYMGNRRLMRQQSGAELSQDLETELRTLEEDGHTAMLVYVDNEYIGIVAVQDQARPEVKRSIEKLRRGMGIKEVFMLTGDNQRVADAVAKDVGITEVYGDLLPEDKVEAIREKRKIYRIAMVGDGVNDAPAMANSHVGISMGAAGSDVALETSHAALLGDSIAQLPFALNLAKQADRIVKQNLFISIGVMLILVPLAISGLTIGPAIVIHEGSTLLVVANALRLLGYKG